MLKKSKEELRRLMELRRSGAPGAFKSEKAYRRKERNRRATMRNEGYSER